MGGCAAVRCRDSSAPPPPAPAQPLTVTGTVRVSGAPPCLALNVTETEIRRLCECASSASAVLPGLIVIVALAPDPDTLARP